MSAPLVDVNVTLSRWPFRRLPLDETPKLVAKLREHQVEQAWAGSYDAILHKDMAGVNARLAQECRELGEKILVPFGTVNPMLPNWEEDLRRCHEEHKMPGIRIYPNYHGYKLNEPIFEKLIKASTERNLIVQLCALMEDRRTQHPLVQVPTVDLGPLPALAKQNEKLRLVILNGFQPHNPQQLLKLVATEKIYFDFSTLDGVAGIENLLKQIPARFLMFGSRAPFFYFESSLLKLKESLLNEKDLKSICSENAKRLLS